MKTYLKEKTIHPTIEHIQQCFDEFHFVGMTAALFYDLCKDDDLPVLSKHDGQVMIQGKGHYLWLRPCCLVSVSNPDDLARKKILLNMGYKIDLSDYELAQIAEAK